MWSFPERGNWATHSGKYRGNWSPYIPRNLILRYSNKNDWVLDQFMGSGTTLIEARLFTKQGNADNLSFIKDESIDLICTHPPYANIIRYSENISGDISHLKYEEFLESMERIAEESYRVIKKQGICAFMIGDVRKHGYILPLGMNSMQKFVGSGFRLKEIVIKEQHNCQATNYWNNIKKTFLMLTHEYIFILEK